MRKSNWEDFAIFALRSHYATLKRHVVFGIIPGAPGSDDRLEISAYST
jgi:hypothetical protein